MSSPTVRSLAHLRKEGYTAQVVEKWNPYGRVRVDLFGFIDIVAICPLGTLGVQATSTGNINARIKKILEIVAAKLWLDCGNRLQVHGWSLKGKAGKRKTYQITVREITLADFEKEAPRPLE